MGNMTLAIPDDLQKKMKRHSDIRWSAVARQAISEKIDMLERVERIAQKSKLTLEDAKILGKKINAAASKRFREQHYP